MDFSEALELIKAGKHLTRGDWSGANKYVAIARQTHVIPNPVEVQMSSAFLYIVTGHSEMVPWTPSQEDLLADDWNIG